MGGEDAGTLDLGDSFTDVPGGTANWSFTGNGNYNDQASSVDIEITKADATCEVTGYSVTYDGDPHTATGTCTGVEDETLSGLDLSGTTHTDAGDYSGDAWSFTDTTGNYHDQNGTVDDLIDKADASCSIFNYHLTYDAAAHTATGWCTGVEDETLSGLDLSGTTHTDAGDYSGDAWSFTDTTGNYHDQNGTVDDLIDKADASCSISGYSGVYDADAHGATGSCEGVGGEDAGTLDLGDSFTDVPGGTANWSFTGNGNYNDQASSVDIEITKADASCSISGYSGVYDADAHGATGSCEGVGGEDAGTLDLGDSFTDVPGGTANWSFTGNGNYNDQASSVDIEITKADATCEVTGYSVTYDGDPHTATGTCTGVEDETLERSRPQRHDPHRRGRTTRGTPGRSPTPPATTTTRTARSTT